MYFWPDTLKSLFNTKMNLISSGYSHAHVKTSYPPSSSPIIPKSLLILNFSAKNCLLKLTTSLMLYEEKLFSNSVLEGEYEFGKPNEVIPIKKNSILSNDALSFR